jgi:hypothetical protein
MPRPNQSVSGKPGWQDAGFACAGLARLGVGKGVVFTMEKDEMACWGRLGLWSTALQRSQSTPKVPLN